MLSAMTMIGGGGPAELEGKGVGPFGVKAMPGGCPGTEVVPRGVTLPVASAANSTKTAFCVLWLSFVPQRFGRLSRARNCGPSSDVFPPPILKAGRLHFVPPLLTLIAFCLV